MLSFNSVSYSDEDVNKENEETEINLDEEELPAIDPFQSSSAATSGASQDGMQVNPDLAEFFRALKRHLVHCVS